MIYISLETIQSHAHELLHNLDLGETVVLTFSGKPVAEVKSLPAEDKVPRPFGLCADKFHVPEDFNAPLPEELLMEFEEK